MTTAEAFIARVRERLSKATRGPWHFDTSHNRFRSIYAGKVAVARMRHIKLPPEECASNMKLIAHAPADLDAALKALERAVEALNICVEGYDNSYSVAQFALSDINDICGGEK